MKRAFFFRLSLSAVLLLVIASVPARAGFYIGARGGLSNENVSVGQVEFNKDSAFLYGAQIGFKFLSLAVEGEFYRAGHSLISGESQPLTNGGQDMDYYYLGVNGKLGLPLVFVYPYLTVGYGTYTADIKDIGKNSDRSFNIGVGVELSVGKVGLFAELRYVDFSMNIQDQNWDFGGLDIQAGFNLHF